MTTTTRCVKQLSHRYRYIGFKIIIQTQKASNYCTVTTQTKRYKRSTRNITSITSWNFGSGHKRNHINLIRYYIILKKVPLRYSYLFKRDIVIINKNLQFNIAKYSERYWRQFATDDELILEKKNFCCRLMDKTPFF